jgi:SAM domain (Sterile alpha motif)
MSIEITDWLRGLGLEQYAPAFRDNDVDSEVLPQLTVDDLISIGVTSVGHRRKLLAAIALLGASAAATRIPTAPVSVASAPAEAERRQLTVMLGSAYDLSKIVRSRALGEPLNCRRSLRTGQSRL